MLTALFRRSQRQQQQPQEGWTAPSPSPTAPPPKEPQRHQHQHRQRQRQHHRAPASHSTTSRRALDPDAGPDDDDDPLMPPTDRRYRALLAQVTALEAALGEAQQRAQGEQATLRGALAAAEVEAKRGKRALARLMKEKEAVEARSAAALRAWEEHTREQVRGRGCGFG